MHIRVITIDLDVPETAFTEHATQRGVRSITISGAMAPRIATQVRDEARHCGFTTGPSPSVLVRGLSWILVEQHADDRVLVQWDDYDRLPRARLQEGALAVGRLVLPLKAPGRVEPGVYRHDEGSSEWLSTYLVAGGSAEALAQEIHTTLNSLGLRGGTVWPPPANGPPRWKVEAHDGSRLVQVAITATSDGAELDVSYVEQAES